MVLHLTDARAPVLLGKQNTGDPSSHPTLTAEEKGKNVSAIVELRVEVFNRHTTTF